MIYDVVLALNGYIGDLVAECVDSGGYHMLQKGSKHINESEKSLVSSLLETGCKYKRLHDFCASVWRADVSLLASCIVNGTSLTNKLEPQETNWVNESNSQFADALLCPRGFYVHAMVNAINVHLENYRRHLLELQKVVLSYPNLPITTLGVAMQPHAEIITVLHQLVFDTYIPMALEKKQKGHLLLCMLRQEGKEGVYKSICDNLYEACLQVFSRQLKYWLSGGILDDPYNEFIIQMRPRAEDYATGDPVNNRVYDWNFKYVLDWKQLGIWHPHDTSPGPISNITCANDVLYLGKIAAIYGKSHFAFDRELNLDDPCRFAQEMLRCRKQTIEQLQSFPDVANNESVIKYLEHVYKSPCSEVLFDLAENGWKVMLEPYNEAAFKRLARSISHHRNFRIRRNIFDFVASKDNLVVLGRAKFGDVIALDSNSQVWQEHMVHVDDGFKSAFSWRVKQSGGANRLPGDATFYSKGGIAMVLQSRVDPAVTGGRLLAVQQQQQQIGANDGLVIQFNMVETNGGVSIDLVVSIGDERMDKCEKRKYNNVIVVVAKHTFAFGFCGGWNTFPGTCTTLVKINVAFTFDEITITCHCQGDLLSNTQKITVDATNLRQLLPLEIGDAHIGLATLDSKIDLEKWTFKSIVPLHHYSQGAKGWNIVLVPNSLLVPPVDASLLMEFSKAFSTSLLKQRCSAALASGWRSHCNIAKLQECLKLRDHLTSVAPALYSKAPASCNFILDHLAKSLGKFATLYDEIIYRHAALAIIDEEDGDENDLHKQPRTGTCKIKQLEAMWLVFTPVVVNLHSVCTSRIGGATTF